MQEEHKSFNHTWVRSVVVFSRSRPVFSIHLFVPLSSAVDTSFIRNRLFCTRMVSFSLREIPLKVSYAERQAAMIVKLVRLVVTEFTENTRIIDGLTGACEVICGGIRWENFCVNRKSINMACFRAIFVI